MRPPAAAPMPAPPSAARIGPAASTGPMPQPSNASERGSDTGIGRDVRSRIASVCRGIASAPRFARVLIRDKTDLVSRETFLL